MSNDTDREIKFKKLQENLRKVIAEAFSKDKRFGNLFKKEIITDILPKFLQDKKPGGGYIFSTSNVPFRGMPLSRYLMVLDVWKANRYY